MFLDRYVDAGGPVAVELVNALHVRVDPPTRLDALRQVLAVDPPSVRDLGERHVAGFVALADALHAVFVDLDAGDDDAAAGRLNALLAVHPAHPHLAHEDGRWRLHHHPADAPLVAMWTSICAEVLARLLAEGHGRRLRLCADPQCRRALIDTTRNRTRRFCAVGCQNRVKAAALRERRRSRAG